jgi:hypothetical protein
LGESGSGQNIIEVLADVLVGPFEPLTSECDLP